MDNSKSLYNKDMGFFTDAYGKQIPYETRVYYSKTKAILWLIFSTIQLSLITYQTFIGDIPYMVVVVFAPVGLYLFFYGAKRLRNRNPQLVLNVNGVQADDLPFYEWKDIYNEKVIVETIGRPTYYFKYNSPSGLREFPIASWGISHKKLEQLLTSYRGRNNHKD